MIFYWLRLKGFLRLLPFFFIVNSCSNHIRNKTFVNTIATFYFRTGPDLPGCPKVQTFNDNTRYGPCNFNKTYGVKYTKDSKYWVAIKNAKSHCGKNIIVYYNNRNIILKIMDECPGCYKDNHLDMSLDALVQLTGSKENTCAIHKPSPRISWKFTS